MKVLGMIFDIIAKVVVTVLWSTALLIGGFVGGIFLTGYAIEGGALDDELLENMKKRGYLKKNRYGTYAVNK